MGVGVGLGVGVGVPIYVSVCMVVKMSISLSISLSISVSISVSISLSLYLFFALHVAIRLLRGKIVVLSFKIAANQAKKWSLSSLNGNYVHAKNIELRTTNELQFLFVSNNTILHKQANL